MARLSLLSLNNADFAHVTRDDAADARCFRYLWMFFEFVITNFQGVITKLGLLVVTWAKSAEFCQSGLFVPEWPQKSGDIADGETTMSESELETRKYIVGWLTFPPGVRDRFMALVPAYVQACLSEPGCLFFEMNPCISDPDVVTLAECFSSEAAHATHLEAPNFKAFWPVLADMAISGRFENVYAGRVAADTVQFKTV